MTLRHVLRRGELMTAALVLATGLTAAAQQPAQPAPADQTPAGAQPAPPTPAAQTPPPAPAAGAAPAKPGGPALAFAADAGFVIFTVRAEGAADFEAFIAKVKDALAQGAKPEYKEMAAGWKIFKVADAPQSGQIMYASVMDPAVKNADYDPVKILADVLPADATPHFTKLKEALVSVNRLSLQTLMKMGGGS